MFVVGRYFCFTPGPYLSLDSAIALLVTSFLAHVGYLLPASIIDRLVTSTVVLITSASSMIKKTLDGSELYTFHICVDQAGVGVSVIDGISGVCVTTSCAAHLEYLFPASIVDVLIASTFILIKRAGFLSSETLDRSELYTGRILDAGAGVIVIDDACATSCTAHVGYLLPASILDSLVASAVILISRASSVISETL